MPILGGPMLSTLDRVEVYLDLPATCDEGAFTITPVLGLGFKVWGLGLVLLIISFQYFYLNPRLMMGMKHQIWCKRSTCTFANTPQSHPCLGSIHPCMGRLGFTVLGLCYDSEREHFQSIAREGTTLPCSRPTRS